jgi:hypothetical protein
MRMSKEAKEAIRERVARVSESLTLYKDGDVLDIPVRDILVDLRHYCDAYKLDFTNEDRIAYSHYSAELADLLGCHLDSDD